MLCGPNRESCKQFTSYHFSTVTCEQCLWLWAYNASLLQKQTLEVNGKWEIQFFIQHKHAPLELGICFSWVTICSHVLIHLVYSPSIFKKLPLYHFLKSKLLCQPWDFSCQLFWSLFEVHENIFLALTPMWDTTVKNLEQNKAVILRFECMTIRHLNTFLYSIVRFARTGNLKSKSIICFMWKVSCSKNQQQQSWKIWWWWWYFHNKAKSGPAQVAPCMVLRNTCCLQTCKGPASKSEVSWGGNESDSVDRTMSIHFSSGLKNHPSVWIFEGRSLSYVIPDYLREYGGPNLPWNSCNLCPKDRILFCFTPPNGKFP